MAVNLSAARSALFCRGVSILLAALLLSSMPVFSQTLEHPIRFTLMHTNDFHSQLGGLGPDLLFTPRANDDDPVMGHAARLMTVIRSVRANRIRNARPVLLVDAGDMLFGSLFHMLGPCADSEYAPEYRFYHEAGYDAISLGNHDFDAEEEGLARSLAKAKKAGYALPFVTSNLSFARAANADSPLRQFVRPGGDPSGEPAFQDFQIRKFPGGADQPPIIVGILGLVGPNAAQLCTATRKTVQFAGFDDKAVKVDEKAFNSFVQNRVDQLRKTQKCHIVIVLLHGGAPEDENLAKEVKGIDLIIAGHTHQAYVRRVGSTIIAQAGHGGASLGVLDLEYDGSGIRLLNPQSSLVSIDDSIPAEPDVLAWLKKANREVNRLIRQTGFAAGDPSAW